MKRIKWAVILIAALSIMFAGCTGPFDKDKYVGNPLGVGLKFLRVTGRANSWDGLDIKYVAAGTGCAGTGDKVVITTSAASGIKIGSAGGNYADIVGNGSATAGPEGSKVFTFTLSDSVKPNADSNIRIQADKANDFNIYEIVVTNSSNAVKFKLSDLIQSLPKGSDFSTLAEPFIKSGDPVYKIGM